MMTPTYTAIEMRMDRTIASGTVRSGRRTEPAMFVTTLKPV